MTKTKTDKLKITIKIPKTFGYVYVTRNLIDGKYYIGQHKSEDLNDDYLGSGKYLKNAIGKYGKDNFEREVLAICDNQEQLNNREIWFIEHAKAKVEHGNYNIADGGENPPTFYGEEHPMYGKPSPMRGVTGEQHHNWGRKVSKETRLKMSKAQKQLDCNSGRFIKGQESNHKGKFGFESSKGVSVINIDTGIIYGSVRDAGRQLNVNYTGIVNVCRGRQKTAHGYRWQYYNDYLEEQSHE